MRHYYQYKFYADLPNREPWRPLLGETPIAPYFTSEGMATRDGLLEIAEWVERALLLEGSTRVELSIG